MPKRKHGETKEERWARKLKKYEDRLQAKKKKISQRVIYSSDEDVNLEEHLEHIMEIPTREECVEGVETIVEVNSDTVNCNEEPVVDDEQLSEQFDPELLQALGEHEPETVEYGAALQTDIATRFQQILLNGLSKENRIELIKKYLFPKNVPMAKAPILNPEIGAMLIESCKIRDKRLLNKQDQLGRAMSALGNAMTELLKKNPNIQEAIRTLNDTGKLIADSHYAETDTRRSVIIPLIDKSLRESFKDRKRDSYLFGDQLGDLVKNSRGIKKTSQMIQSSVSTSSNLNWKGPPPRSSQMRRNQYRTGGQQQQYSSYRRRVLPPPAPPPSLRQPPPPPPSQTQWPARRNQSASTATQRGPRPTHNL